MLSQITQAPKNCRNWLFKDNLKIEATAKNDPQPNIFFIFCIVFYGLYLVTIQPEWVLGGGMWAEMATNYYVNANNPSILVNLFSTDAGYIPLPQRIIAYIGSALNLPSTSIPYYYTWSGILITGSMAGAFCLSPFRAIIRSDYLRLLSSISILLVADFETRTFINFTYFSAFYIAIITALALVQKNEESPWWAWAIPVLIISKPAVLSVFPAMILAALVSKARFRLITLSVALLCIVQVLNIYFSHSAGAFSPVYTFSTLEKIIAAGKFFIGLLGAFSAGKGISPEAYRPLWLGSFAFLSCLLIISKKRTNASALILVGLSMLFFNVLLNVFALSDSWNIKMENLIGIPFYRHIIVGYFGVVLVIVGLIDTCAHLGKPGKSSFSLVMAPLIFILWFFLSGWFNFSAIINRAPRSPVINNSQWQDMAPAIASSESICIPIDPLGWMFSKNCSQLNPNINVSTEIEYRPLQLKKEYFSIEITPPTSASKKNLISMAVLAQPSISTALVQGEAVLTMKDGSIKYLSGSRQLATSGGLLIFTNKGTTPLIDIESVILKFNAPINIGFFSGEPGDHPAVLWMGN
ncbi:hypothetical protein [Pseudomonas helleri]|uniref:Uncharacterized protein n=1 Tax=Pseudomonas helleri TaxID=1608996 RepID=A0A7X1XF16_9PSED|nr:hypothetical protein [Pseudomonas helleri]MQT90330.1 hypothetical protein [Pseudomonas helleri]